MNIVLFGNCFITFIGFLLKQHPGFKDCNFNYIYNYTINRIEEKHLTLLNNADLIILQYIINKNRFFFHKTIIKHIKNSKNAKIILYPHYTFHSYFHNNLIQINSILENDFIKTKELDDVCNFDMYNFVLKNYKRIQLFQCSGHPLMVFFIELVNQILIKIDLSYKNQLIQNIRENYYIQSNEIYFLNKNICDKLNLEFNTTEDDLILEDLFHNSLQVWETKSITEKFPNGKHFLPLDYAPVFNKYRKCWKNLKITISKF